MMHTFSFLRVTYGDSRYFVHEVFFWIKIDRACLKCSTPLGLYLSPVYAAAAVAAVALGGRRWAVSRRQGWRRVVKPYYFSI